MDRSDSWGDTSRCLLPSISLEHRIYSRDTPSTPPLPFIRHTPYPTKQTHQQGCTTHIHQPIQSRGYPAHTTPSDSDPTPLCHPPLPIQDLHHTLTLVNKHASSFLLVSIRNSFSPLIQAQCPTGCPHTTSQFFLGTIPASPAFPPPSWSSTSPSELTQSSSYLTIPESLLVTLQFVRSYHRPSSHHRPSFPPPLLPINTRKKKDILISSLNLNFRVVLLTIFSCRNLQLAPDASGL